MVLAVKMPCSRCAHIEDAMSRNISTGAIGVPYIVVDIVHAFDQSGANKGQSARPGDAFHGVKDKLWNQCKYLGGDAVLFSRFGWDKGTAVFKNHGAAFSNAMVGVIGAATRTGVSGSKSEYDTQTVITLWGMALL